jgi:hypothetical protein
VDELHTSDEGASNVNPRVRNLVTTRVMYYTFSTTGIIPTKFLNKYFSTTITYRYIISADGLIVWELSSKYANSTFSENTYIMT